MKIDLPVCQEKVFSSCSNATHMPFFDGTTLLFCQARGHVEKKIKSRGSIWKSMRQNRALAERFKDLPKYQSLRYRAWKLAYCLWENKVIHPIKTGLPEEGIECSPAFYWEDDKIHLSFIGGCPGDHNIVYRLYTLSGDSLETLGAAQPVSRVTGFVGFVSPHHICWGGGPTIHLKEKATDHTFELVTGFTRVVRATFLAAEPAKLLITGIDAEGISGTLLHDLTDGTTSTVTSGSALYKSTIHQNIVLFAKKTAADHESRELHQGPYELAPCATQIYTK